MASVTPVADPADIAAVEAVLKEVYVADSLESQLNDDVMILDWFDETTEYTDSDGLKASVPLKIGRTGGLSARGIGQKLGAADHQKKDKASYNYKNLYLQVKVEGPVVARMKTNRQAVVRHIDDEINGGIEDWQRDFCRQLHTFGDAAITLTGLPGNASSTTIPIGTGNLPLLERGWLYEGQVIQAGTLADPVASCAGQRIVSIDDDEAAPTITLDSATAITAGHHLFLYGNRTALDGSYEVNGLGNIVDDEVELGGVDPTDPGKSYWKSVVNDNGGTPRALSLSLMNSTNRKVRQRGGKVSDVLGSLGLQQKYYELLQSQVRFAGDTKLAGGSTEGPQFNHVTFVGDPDCLPNRVYFLVKKALQMYSAGKVAWQNQTTGGNILAWSQDYDAFVARAAKYCQTGTNRRRSLAVLDDITEPS